MSINIKGLVVADYLALALITRLTHVALQIHHRANFTEMRVCGPNDNFGVGASTR